MIRIGITGQSGFVGRCLHDTLQLYPDRYECIPFEDAYFKSAQVLGAFVRQCDVIVHLAAMNRHPDQQVLYRTNMQLVDELIGAMKREEVTPHVLFSSSTQEENETEYGRSKREGRALLEQWARSCGASFTGLVVPNVYGPYGRPNYNSFVATFAHKLTHGEQPEILQDASVRLIYVGSLVEHILEKIDRAAETGPRIERDAVPWDVEMRVSEVLSLFERFREEYFERGIIPELHDRNQINLFNTFRGYIDHDTHFPVELVRHEDPRGVFVETIRSGVGGQVSFSTTVPGVTRGNHFHTRKIERFTVIRGKARIQLRKIGTDRVIDLLLDGNRPAYVDMPVWYTHNIENIGDEELYTQFWINEPFNPNDPDTFFQTVVCEVNAK